MLAVGHVLANLAEVVAPLIIVRLLGRADVGILSSLLLINTTIAMVFTLGLPGTLAFHLPGRAAGERRAIAGRMVRLLALLGVAAVLVQLTIAGLSLANVLQTEIKLHYLVALAGLPLGDLPMRVLPNLLVIENRDRAAAVMSIVRSLGMSLGTLVPLALEASVWTVMLTLSGVGVVFGLVTILTFVVIYRGVRRVPGEPGMRGMIRFSLPIAATDLISNINSRFDRFLIITLGAIAYAEYAAGSWQVPIIPSLAYAVGVAYAPRFSVLFRGGRMVEAVEMWRAQAAKTALLVVPLALVFVVAAEETITLFFTSEYIRGASVLRLYSLMAMGRITAFGTILIAAGKPQYLFRSAMIAFVSNVLVSVPLVYLIGFNGPALGALLAFVPTVCGYTWYIAKAAGVDFRDVYPLRAWLRVVCTAAPAVAVALAFKFMTQMPTGASLGIQAAIVLVGYSLVGSATGLIRRDEWVFLREYVLLRFLRRSTVN